MSLGTNIQFMRKNLGFTQENFSEKMSVSRQTISKWESDSCYPEMEKLILMCELFSCDLDTLVRGDTEKSVASDEWGYDKHMNSNTKKITTGIVLILSGLSAMFLLQGLNVKEDFATIFFMGFVAVAVAFFIVAGIEHDSFQKKHPNIQPFYTQDEIDKFDKKFPKFIVTGITLIMLGVIYFLGAGAIIGESVIDNNVSIEGFVMAGFFVFITIAVGIIVYSGMQKSKYDLNEYNKNEFNKKSKQSKKDKISGAICAVIMILATGVFLVTGFVDYSWQYNWIVFPIGGLLCAIVSIIANALSKENDEDE